MTHTPVTSKMQFGLFMQPVHHPTENPTLALERDLELLQHLDRLGYDDAWIGEHHSTGWETIASPEIFMAVAAERTRYLRLGTGIIPLAAHQPLLVADRMVLLDHLTRGRTMLGVGIGGGLPSDLHIFGLTGEQAYHRFFESFDVIMRLLTTADPITEKTDWYELQDAVLQLKPYTQPHFPFAAASSNPRVLALMGQVGGQILTAVPPERVPDLFADLQRGAALVGRTASRQQIRLTHFMHLAESREQAAAEIKAAAIRENNEFNVKVNGRLPAQATPDEWFEALVEREIVGTPADAIHKISSMLEQSGGFGGLLLTAKEWASREAQWRSYELFARSVMPHFQGQLPSLARAAATASRINQPAR